MPTRHESLEVLAGRISACRACPRLVAWREEVAATRRAAYRHEEYWGRPVPGFGDPDARILLVGLAPAAHGGNRTGRVFTGDRSGDFLYAVLHRAGLASQAESTGVDDGLELRGAYVSAAVRCAPPANRPTTDERDRCLPWLEEEIGLLEEVRVVVALGGFAFDIMSRLLGIAPKPRFGHGAGALAVDGRLLLGAYHPSQQNTFTGRLTPAMLDDVLVRAVQVANGG